MNETKKITNAFVLTTEYHFLLSMSIILNKYSSGEFKSILVFTGPRLSGIAIETLPPFVEVVKIMIDHEMDLKEKISKTFFHQNIQNVFVFTAYRFLETYVLCKISKYAKRHLVQDGSYFYLQVKKSVFVSKLKETLKIYRDLWNRGLFFVNPVLYKRHPAQSANVDFVWLTNPELYIEPKWFRRPLITIDLLKNENDKKAFISYFPQFVDREYSKYLIYLSANLTKVEAIQREIELIKSITSKFETLTLLVKVHPNSPPIQVDQIRAEFGANVIENSVPAELYIMCAKDSCVMGAPSTALFFENPSCSYFSLDKIYQSHGIFPRWIEVKFPKHVKTLGNLD